MLPEFTNRHRLTKASSPFSGFTSEVFSILGRLQMAPHIETYHREREALRAYLDEPFKRYRDAIVLAWVLPNDLPFETERNVFSRVLKNDFGAGGSHHHKWLSFYRYGYSRLKDLQLIHAVHPDGFSIALYLGTNAPDILSKAKTTMLGESIRFRELLSELSSDAKRAWHMVDRSKNVLVETGGFSYQEPSKAHIEKMAGFRIGRHYSRQEVLGAGLDLPNVVAAQLVQLWPLYRFLVS